MIDRTSRPWFGLLGSGEFEPWSAEVDRRLLEHASGDGRVLVLPTASAAEGDEVFERWGAMGLEHYASLGIDAEVLSIRSREDAERPEHATRVGRASMAFFSGGNPAALAETLAGTAFWSALLASLARGMAYAGCSAGVAALGARAPDSATRSVDGRLLKPGLGLFTGVTFGPHWDALDGYVPGLRAFIEGSVPNGEKLLAIDERTAVVGDGSSWTVVGAGGAYLKANGSWRSFAAGSAFDEPLGLTVPGTGS